MNIASKQIQWVLNKSTPNITLSKQQITLDSDNLTDTFTITTNSTGNLSVSSSDTSIATVSLSGNTVTVTAQANGTCKITVNVTESTDGNYLSGSKELSVTCNLISTVLNDNSWSTISQCFTNGTAASYWNIGDTKAVTLNGDTTGCYGTKSFNNATYYATLIGIDHNSSYEGTGKGHFILAKNFNGKDICFYAYKMNENNVTTGGWNGSKMKQTTMTEFKNCLPAELRAVLKNVTKYTHNTMSGSGNDSSSNVTASTELLFLLSEFEVYGKRTYANSYEKNKQAQYAYYANGNSKVRYRDDSPTSADFWWLRSAVCDITTTSYFCYANGNDGKLVDYAYGSANYGNGLSPAFCI